MLAIQEIAEKFFEACETGKGWEVCRNFCTPDSTFTAQAAALTGVDTLQAYTDWMKGFFTLAPDARYEVKAFAVDEGRNKAIAYAVFSALTLVKADHCRQPGRKPNRTTSMSWNS